MKAEIISVGTELLLGEIVDTNASYISQQLALIGIDIHYRHTVGDNLTRLTQVISTALGRADVIIITGGLGPTEDDLTREAIAAAAGRKLVRRPETEQWLREFFAARGRELSAVNLKQADVPEGGEHLENTCGTAPGIHLIHNERHIFAAPGPPTELREMWQQAILPRLLEITGPSGQIFSRSINLCDIGESMVAQQLEDIINSQTDPSIALYASPGFVRVRLTTRAADGQTAQALFAPVEQVIRKRMGLHVLGIDGETMPEVIGRLLRERKEFLAVAESCTGGLVAGMITDVPGASNYFLTGIVAYANETKIRLLKVPPAVIEEHGAVSEECARAMAEGVRRDSGADFGLATTGIAGPGGGTPEKPVGLVYYAVADARGVVCERQFWPGTREQFKRRAAQLALSFLRKRILGLV